MTEKEIEEKANEIRSNDKARLIFCKNVGITNDEYFIKCCGDFEIEDMIRAFENGKAELKNMTSIASYQQSSNMKRYFTIEDLESDKRRLQATISQLSTEFNRRIAEYEDLLKWHKGELPQITKKNKETLYLAWTKYGRAGSPCIVTPLKEKYMNLWTGAIVDKEDVVSWKEIELPTE